MNASVSATGLEVKAKASGSLYISNAVERPNYTSIFANTVSLADAEAVELMPTSSNDLTKWYSVGADQATAYGKASSSAYEKIGDDQVSNYVLKKTVWVRSESAFEKLVLDGCNVTITAGTDNDTLGQSLAIAFKVSSYIAPTSDAAAQETDTKTFVANEATAKRHGAIKATGTDDSSCVDTTITWIDASTIGTGTSKVQPVLYTSTVADNTNYVYQIDIYMFFDGQSDSCYSNAFTNAVSLDAKVNLSFSTVAATPAT